MRYVGSHGPTKIFFKKTVESQRLSTVKYQLFVLILTNYNYVIFFFQLIIIVVSMILLKHFLPQLGSYDHGLII